MLHVPAELGHHADYELLKELGQGGIGTVYLARNRMMERFEVLKVVNPALLERTGALERFQQEIRAAARLNHANIVAAYRVLHVGGLLVFAMEHIDGQDLARLVERRGPLPVANAAYYAHEAALGLEHALQKGMVHRDIKPGNLMLAIEGKTHLVKILDFGLAKATSEKEIAAGLTKSGQMLGTPEYVAPEQILDAQTADIRADIYSLGCTLYFLLSGAPPFADTNLYKILHAHQTRQARRLEEVRAEVPAELATVVAKMMAKDPAARYQTPAEVAKALVPFFKPAAPVTSPERGFKLTARRRPWVAVAGGGAAFLAALVGVVALVPNHKGREAARVEVPDDGSVNVKPRQPPTAEEPAADEKPATLDTPIVEPVDATKSASKPLVAANSSPISLAALQNDGAFGFPQARAQVIVENDELRLSFCNNQERLYVQAIIWIDSGEPVVSSSATAYSDLTLALAANLRRSATVDRRYHLDAKSDFACQVLFYRNGRTFTKTDSQGRGQMRYLKLEDGRHVRVDSFLVPLTELKKQPGDRLGVVFDAVSAKPSSNTGCGLFVVTLSKDVAALEITESPSEPERASTAAPVSAQTPPPDNVTAASRTEAPFDQWVKEIRELPVEKQGEAVAKKLQELNPGFDGQVTPKVEGGVITELKFVSDQVSNIAPVSALKDLKILSCRGSAKQDKGAWRQTKGVLSDLSPLTGMRLSELDCFSTNVADLSPLKGMPLQKLVCGQTRVSDLSSLRGMPLTLLNLNGTPIADLSPLRDLPLRALICSYSKVQDLSPLRGTRLTSLCLCGTPVVDLSPLTAMPLKSLHLAQTEVTDLSPLAGMPLEDLTCDSKPGLDTEVLRSIASLAKINYKPVADFWKTGGRESIKADDVRGSDTP